MTKKRTRKITLTDPPQRPVESPRPLSTLLAAAQRLTQKTIRDTPATSRPKAQGWQSDAWDMYDLVGEQRFLLTTLANRCSQARFFVGRLPEDPTEPPDPTEDPTASGVFDSLADSPAHLAQMIARLAVNLGVAGDGYLIGIPKALLNPPQPTSADAPPTDQITPLGNTDADGALLPDADTLEWRMFSVSEIKWERNGDVTIQLGEAKSERLTTSPDDLFMVRVWRPHPRRWWEADSATRACLPVLRELVGLTMHISAQVDSRLAGAGVFIVPQSASEAIRRDAGVNPEDDADPFTDALIEAMTTPIADRSNASAVVPLVLTVPDDSAEKFQHISFASGLDAEARALRDEAIRRLALGQDAPPEILLGVSDMNHWGAWLVREDVIKTHIEPVLALICDALTTQFLWPVLIEQGIDEDKAREYVIWYDVDHLIMRPNKPDAAVQLHAAGVLSDAALRDSAGFNESDAPVKLDQAVQTALDMVRQAPSLAAQPGLTQLIAEIRSAINGTSDTSGDSGDGAAAPPAPQETQPGTPDGSGNAGPPEDTGGQPAPETTPDTAPAAAATNGNGQAPRWYVPDDLADDPLPELRLAEAGLLAAQVNGGR